MKAAIVIPTYNERENVRQVAERITALPAWILGDLQIVAVDDGSPDGTGEVWDEVAAQHSPRVHVIHRPGKRGRGTAGVAGFLYALEQDVDCIIEMDADGSHDPCYLPIFLDLVRHYDVVIGSRYVEGGAEVRRGMHRRLVSFIANLFYRLILGIRIRDVSGGFKCYRKTALQEVDLSRLHSKGYSIGMEVLYRLAKSGCTFVEVPILYQDRTSGSSKFRLKEGAMALGVALRLAFEFRGKPGGGDPSAPIPS